MPAYVVVTPLCRGMQDDPVPPGEVVELKAKEGDALVAIGALTPGPRGLSDMKRPELVKEAEKEGVEITSGMTNVQVVAAIEAKRATNG